MMMHPRDVILCRRLPQCQINGTSHGASVEPAIGVDADCLSSEFLQVARPLDRFEQGQQTWASLNITLLCLLTETDR